MLQWIVRPSDPSLASDRRALLAPPVFGFSEITELTAGSQQNDAPSPFFCRPAILPLCGAVGHRLFDVISLPP